MRDPVPAAKDFAMLRTAMLRTGVFAPLFVVLAMTSTTALAREAGLTAAADETCADKQAGEKGSARASTTANAARARETRARHGAQGGAPSGRMPSPRWHSFLPGMIR